jgi:hypothetical protein
MEKTGLKLYVAYKKDTSTDMDRLMDILHANVSERKQEQLNLYSII